MSNKTQVSDKEMDSVAGGTTRGELKAALERASGKLADGDNPEAAFEVINRSLYLSDYEKGGKTESDGKGYTPKHQRK